MRKSIALIVLQAGHLTHTNQQPALMAAPIVGENSIGIRLACRSFQAVISQCQRQKMTGGAMKTILPTNVMLYVSR